MCVNVVCFEIIYLAVNEDMSCIQAYNTMGVSNIFMKAVLKVLRKCSEMCLSVNISLTQIIWGKQ